MCDVFDVPKVRRFVQLMKDFDLSELELSQGDVRISLKRGGVTEIVAAPAVAAAPAAAAVPATAPAEEPAAPVGDASYIATITSPIVGTFYSKANPNAAPYVSVGSTVSDEQTVCIIEAMKVMNQLPAGVSGKITAILAKDGDSVEYGQPLFKVDTRG